MKSILRSIPDTKALIVGDAMIDHYVFGSTERVSPEAPVLVVRATEHTVRPGGAANTAANMVALGVHVIIACTIGQDADGKALEDALAALEVDASGLIVDNTRVTTSKTRVYARGQQLLRIDEESLEPLAPPESAAVIAVVHGAMPDADVAVISDYAKGVVTAEVATATIATAQRHGKPVLVDPKGLDYEKYAGASVITPNLAELQQAVNTTVTSDDDIVDAARVLAARLGGDTAILVTRGPDGMTLVRRTGVWHLPTEAEAVYDVTGAGDTVLACLAAALAAGADMADAAAIANRAAAVVVRRLGTCVVSLTDLIAALPD